MTNVTHFPAATTEDERGPSKFSLAYAKWMRARADVMQIENAGPSVKFGAPECQQQEDALGAASDAECDAVWEMIRAPAETTLDIQRRARVMQSLMLWCDNYGWYLDNRHILMMQSLVLDLQGDVLLKK